MPVNDQDDLASLAVLDQTLDEVEEQRSGETLIKARKRSVPVFETAAIMFVLKRLLPVPLVTGVCPTGAHVRPAV